MPRRKKQSVLGTLLIELSAVAGILGISQPAMRDNLWALIQGPGQIQHSASQSLSHPSTTKFQSLPEVPFFEPVDQQAYRSSLSRNDGINWIQPRSFE